MAKAIMIQGTASNTGKTLLTAALCRIFQQDGYRAVPFKSQNMALNSYITADGFEMGRAQVMQAEAAGIEPDVRMNPILLKPTSDQRSEVIVRGKSIGTMSAKDYFAFKKTLLPAVQEAYEELAAQADIMVIEGAGSPVEINLKSEDIVNMGMAALAQAPVLIVGDIDRGGVFASLLGTMLLFTEEERGHVKGVVVNKFRGDVDILLPGLATLADMIQVPVLGVVPFLEVKVDDEDSLTDRFASAPEQGLVDIAVIRLPRMTNYTDFAAFEYREGVSLRYVRSRQELGSPDLIILPGTKNCMEDGQWLRQSGLGGTIVRLAAHTPVMGISGGMNLLGQRIIDPHGLEKGGEVEGLGLLPLITTLGARSVTENRQRQCKGNMPSMRGFFTRLSGLAYDGYAMDGNRYDLSDDSSGNFHGDLPDSLAGNLPGDLPCDLPGGLLGDFCGDESFMNDGGYEDEGRAGEQDNEDRLFFVQGHVFGSRLHGLFDKEAVAKNLVGALLSRKGLKEDDLPAFDLEVFKQEQYDVLADAVRKSIDMKRLYEIIEEGV